MSKRIKWPSWMTRLLYKDRWFLAIRRRTTTTSSYCNTIGYQVLYPPRDRFYADPFLLKWQQHSYLFFEDYRYDKAKGLISCMTLDDDGRPITTDVVLERPYHLSFPFVFAWDGEMWMVPETSTNHTIELYRARHFPYAWQQEVTLMRSVQASDTILLHYADKWWLFTSIDGEETACYGNLSLFFAQSLLGPWVAHPRNPVVLDTSRARPAGAIFSDNGILIRPGQDCSDSYGKAIQFHCIETLTETQYQERPIWKTTPSWSAQCVGTHTYNCNDDFEVLDGYTRDLDLYGKWLSLRGWLQNLRLRNFSLGLPI